MEQRTIDFVIVGYGPVGQMLAILLGSKGYQVAVYERQLSAYPLPRAVCMDHEIFRAVAAAGAGATLSQMSAPSPRYQWFNAAWEMLLDIDWTVESVSGGPEAHFFHQPSLEAAFDKRVRTMANVDVNLGWEAVALGEDPTRPNITFKNKTDGTVRSVSSKYIIGADGANSFVRNSLGIEWFNRGFQADWLVVDVLINEGVTVDVPPAGQLCDPERPTTFVPGGIYNGREIRRWEFMRLPDEPKEALESEDAVWKMLSRWVDPSQAVLVRHAFYTFKSLSACNWRKGNVFIAGDAAHLMPPFMGQGMCSGLRDAFNLAWKFDVVMKGHATAELLDTYELERKPHADRIIDISTHLGSIVCVADKVQAAARDRSYKDGTAAAPPEFPHLQAGLIDPDSALAGKLSPHARVIVGQRGGWMDEVVGTGFAVLYRSDNAARPLKESQLTSLRSLGASLVQFSSDGLAGDVHDVDGKLGAFFDAHNIAALVIRPDFYIYGAVSDIDALPACVDRLLRAMNSPGMALATAA